MSEPPPDRILSPDGTSGWYAFMPDGSAIPQSDDSWAPPPDGSTIRLMGEDSVDVPLWDEGGLMFNDQDELEREWTLSQELVADLVTWARDWQTHSNESEHDSRAALLVRRLSRELNARFQVVFHP